MWRHSWTRVYIGSSSTSCVVVVPSLLLLWVSEQTDLLATNNKSQQMNYSSRTYGKSKRLQWALYLWKNLRMSTPITMTSLIVNCHHNQSFTVAAPVALIISSLLNPLSCWFFHTTSILLFTDQGFWLWNCQSWLLNNIILLSCTFTLSILNVYLYIFVYI